jgi:L-threonylcarbamoyladenylate synthase
VSALRVDARVEPFGDLGPVAGQLRSDGLIAYPTETVYGLGGACTREAVERLRALKTRGGEQSFLALVPSVESVAELRWTEAARELASVFWPGALTLVLADPQGIFPGSLRGSRTGGVAVRLSPHPVVAAILEEFGAPITSTSLNLAGEVPAASAEEASEVLRQLGGSDVILVDGGGLPRSAPSTLVDCTGQDPVVLREGTLPVQRLRCAIPSIHGIGS